MVNRKADRNHDQRRSRGQHGDGTKVPRTRPGGSLNFAREDHAFGSRSPKEARPRIGQRFRRHRRQLLPERPLGLRQLPSDETGQLLEVKAAIAAFLQMDLEINKLRALQKAAGSKRTKRFVRLMLRHPPLLMLRHTCLQRSVSYPLARYERAQSLEPAIIMVADTDK